MSTAYALDVQGLTTREQFYVRADAGVYGHARVELLDGHVVEKEPMGPRHGHGVRRIAQAITSALTAADLDELMEVSWQTGLAVSSTSVLLPDITVLDAEAADRVDENPSRAYLAVEVAMTTLATDLEKASRYALGVQTYWVVDLLKQRVMVHEEPRPVRARRHREVFAYTSIKEFSFDADLTVPLAGSQITINVAQALSPRL